MGLLSRVVYRAEVRFSGLDTRDILTADPAGNVTLDSCGAADGPQEKARFAGMCIVAMLRATRKARDYVPPFCEVCSTTCDELLTDSDPAYYDLAARWRPYDRAAAIQDFAAETEIQAEVYGRSLSPVGSLMTISFPRLSEEHAGRGERRFRAALEEGKRRDDAWVRLRSRNPMLSAWGVPLILAHLARHESAETTQRAAAVGKRLFELYDELTDGLRPLRHREATALYRAAGSLAASSDPLSAAVHVE